MLTATYLRYESDLLNSKPTKHNPRVAGRRTTFAADGVDRVDVDSSEFDGVGHYRKIIESGTFPTPMTRTTTTTYNVADSVNPNALQTGTLGSTVAPFQLPSSTSNWVLGNYTSVTSSMNGASAIRQFCFDSGTGFLRGTRTLAGATPANTDLVSAYVARTGASSDEPNGYTMREAYYGGDQSILAAVSQASLCGAVDSLLTSTPTYDIRHTNQYGVRKTTQYDNPAGSAIPVMSRTIDVNTGLMKTSADSADVTTTLTYDALRRTLSLSTPGFGPVAYTYTAATSNTPAKATVTQSTGSQTATYELEFDHLGRLARERQKMPGVNVWSTRKTAYDILGRKASASEWLSATEAAQVSTPYITSTLYDALGRPKTIIAPDGAQTTFDYVGSKKVLRTVAGVATPTGDRSVTTTEEYDAFGQLVAVREPAGPTSAASPVGGEVVTRYGYDLQGHLGSVAMHASGSDEVQRRSFQYDQRGLLVSEEHPESGITGYSGYDARGHLGLRTQGSLNQPSLFDLRYTYDRAERVTKIESRNPFYVAGSTVSYQQNEFRLSKEFVFAASNEGNNLIKGKLEKAIRNNWGPVRRIGAFSSTTAYQSEPADDLHRVTETYAYADAAGRRTNRTTQIDKIESAGAVAWSKNVTQAQSYDGFGNVETITYPECVQRTVSGSRIGTLSRSFDAGRLVAVPGFATAFQFWPGGEVRSILHGNGVLDTRDRDPHGMARPRSIKFETWSSCQAPAISVQPTSKSIVSGTTAALSVSATGSSLQYRWYEVNGGSSSPIANATSNTYTTPTLTADRTYFVHVSNECNSAYSFHVRVSVTAAAPVIEVEPASAYVKVGDSRQLAVVARGSGTLTYAWYRGTSGVTTQPVGSGASSFVTPAVTQRTEYWVRVTNSGGSADSATAVLVVQPTTPGNLTAVRNGSSIAVQWSGTAGAEEYYVERAGGGAFQQVYAGSGTTYSDPNVIAGRTYAYRVRAAVMNEAQSGIYYSSFSSSVIESMRTFTAVVVGQDVEDTHLDDLREGLNALRTASGLPPVTWSSILPPGTEIPADGAIIRAVHLTTLIARVNEALAVLGAVAPPVVDMPSVDGDIKASHINLLQERMR